MEKKYFITKIIFKKDKINRNLSNKPNKNLKQSHFRLIELYLKNKPNKDLSLILLLNNKNKIKMINKK